MQIKARHELLSSLNPISIADIVLLLLIFFLLTSTYVLEPGIRVKLPASTSAEVVSKKEIVVTITKEGELFLGDKKVGLPEFATLLEAELKESEQKLIIIRTDKEVEVDRLVRIMDLSRSAGGEKFFIATRRAE
ncbi:biopolymer transporter ExbD [candidate division WOR-3 bacterium]|nr:biopolymer transporter ExbD [candidate division WOR-3 bacterium]